MFVQTALNLQFLLQDWSGPADPVYALPFQTVDPVQLTSSEASWSGSALFVIKYVNLDQVIWLVDN